MKSIVVLISGRGSNLRAIVDARLPLSIARVISSQPDVGGLTIAKSHDIATSIIDHRRFDTREAFDRALADAIDQDAPDLIVLAGFMRVLTAGFVARYSGKLINIHPSLLPAFAGLHTHRRALEAGVKIHGCTVHFVTASLDNGPIVIQAAVPVRDDDDEAALAARVLEREHRIYPQALRWFAEDRLMVEGNRVRIAGHEIETPELAT